jgi:mannosyltransferase
MVRRTFGQDVVALFTPARLLILIVLLGGLLRFYRFTALSLWLDEGFTVYYSRLPWRTVLGLDGAYDVHPPLYYALVKSVSLVLPEGMAGRVISVVAGTLTILVLFALVARLAGAWVALLSSLVLATSPLHIWYSQEARQYALVVLLICTSYLALIAFDQTLRLRWALLYFAAMLVSIYIEYSAIYALIPQSLILAVIIRQQGRRAIPLIGAVAGAILGFLPWLPQLLRAAGNVGSQERLVVTPVRVASSLLSIMGLAEPLQGQSEPGGAVSTVATQPPNSLLLYAILLVGAVPAMLVGIAALMKGSRLAASVMLCLFAGTIATAIIISLIYPGYVKRTVLSAVLGWALLVGAAPFASRLAPAFRAMGRASVAFCLAVSLVVLGITYATADKQHWRELAADAATATQDSAVHGSDQLLLTYPTVTDTLLDVYQPHLLDTPHLRIDDGGSIPPFQPGSAAPHTIRFAYIEVAGTEALRTQLAALGYTRTSHQAYPGTLYLDSYVLP